MTEAPTRMSVIGSGKIYVPPNSCIRGFYADMSFLEVDERLYSLSITPSCSDFGPHNYHLIECPNPEAMLEAHIPYGQYLPGSLTHALAYMASCTQDLLERIECHDLVILGMRLRSDGIKLVPRLTFVDRAATKVRLELIESTVGHLSGNLLLYTTPDK